MAKRRWRDLGPLQRAGVVVAGAVQLGLLAAAQRDLGRRRATEVRGPRWVWRLVVLVNFVGPAAYFLLGRRPAPAR